MSSITKTNFKVRIKHCLYKVCLKFSAFDVLTGEELKIDSVRVDDASDPIYPDEPEGVPVQGNESVLRYYYEIEIDDALQQCKLDIEKQFYLPYSGRFNLDVKSIHDDRTIIDLGRIGLLKDTSEDAFILLWDEFPKDLDMRVKHSFSDTPIGIAHLTNKSDATLEDEYAKMSVDSSAGYGPETVVVKKWMDIKDIRTNGQFEFYVNWYKDDVNDSSGSNEYYPEP